jgi:regulator of RNase E activity RraA
MGTLSDETRAKLKTVSTATVCTALYKRGLRNQFIQDVHPLNTSLGNMVGEAFTLRYIPAREDLNPLSVFQSRAHPQRKAIEDCPPGAVMVIDSRKDARAASAGSILVTRLMKRGVAGVVTIRPDQSDAASGDRYQRADRMRRCAGMAERCHPGRR